MRILVPLVLVALGASACDVDSWSFKSNPGGSNGGGGSTIKITSSASPGGEQFGRARSVTPLEITPLGAAGEGPQAVLVTEWAVAEQGPQAAHSGLDAQPVAEMEPGGREIGGFRAVGLWVPERATPELRDFWAAGTPLVARSRRDLTGLLWGTVLGDPEWMDRYGQLHLEIWAEDRGSR